MLRVRFRSYLLLIAIAAASASCGNSDPSEVRPLPKVEGANYELTLGTWLTGDYADEPFRLTVTANDIPGTIIEASQCRNVSVGQAPDAIFVFYEHLALRHFAGEMAYVPPIQLCNLRFPECVERQEQFRQQQALSEHICTFDG